MSGIHWRGEGFYAKAPAQGLAEELAAQAALDAVANQPGFAEAWIAASTPAEPGGEMAEEFERSSAFHFMGTDTGEAERLAASLGYSRPVWIDTEDLPSFNCVIRYD